MPTRSTITSAAALAFGAVSAAAAQTWTKVRIGTEGAYPPWNYADGSGELIGLEIDLARDLGARMQVECELIAQDWASIIPALRAGAYDAIMAGMPITEERKKLIHQAIADARADGTVARLTQAWFGFDASS